MESAGHAISNNEQKRALLTRILKDSDVTPEMITKFAHNYHQVVSKLMLRDRRLQESEVAPEKSTMTQNKPKMSFLWKTWSLSEGLLA